METLVAILIIALIAAVVYIVMQRRPAAGGRPADRPEASPLGPRGRGARSADPMADAVHEHARAMEPAEVVAAEQRLQAEARNVAAGLQAGANGAYAAPAAGAPYAAPPTSAPHAVPAAGAPYAAPAAGAVPPTDPGLDRTFDPATGERTDGYGDPANDPRYNDPKYDGRLAADYEAYREQDPNR